MLYPELFAKQVAESIRGVDKENRLLVIDFRPVSPISYTVKDAKDVDWKDRPHGVFVFERVKP